METRKQLGIDKPHIFKNAYGTYDFVYLKFDRNRYLAFVFCLNKNAEIGRPGVP